jgi:cobalamin synthase
MKMWSKLDEVIGACLLTGIAAMAMFTGYDHGLAQAAVAGIVALLCVGAAKGKPGGENGQVGNRPRDSEG